MLGFLSAPVLLALAITVYFKLGSPPVAVADRPLPFEKLLLRRPVNRRVDYELTGPPFASSEEALEAGARTYKRECASCHGTPGHNSPFAARMYPKAPQLLNKGGPDEIMRRRLKETGRVYWKIAHGIRLTGMPSYSNVLTEAEMWQLTLLVKNAGDRMSAPVIGILNQ